MTTTGGEQIVAALLDGAPSICELGGVERSFGVVGCGRDQDTWTVARFGRWMHAHPGLEQPGAVAVLLDHCLGETIFRERPEGSWSLTTELGFDVLVPPGEVVLTAWPRHRGRTVAEVGVLGTDSAGRTCVSATVTARRPG